MTEPLLHVTPRCWWLKTCCAVSEGARTTEPLLHVTPRCWWPKTCCAVSEGADVRGNAATEPETTVRAVLFDVHMRLTLFGAREGFCRSLGSVFSGAVTLFLGSAFRGGHTCARLLENGMCTENAALSACGSFLICGEECEYGELTDEAVDVADLTTGKKVSMFSLPRMMKICGVSQIAPAPEENLVSMVCYTSRNLAWGLLRHYYVASLRCTTNGKLEFFSIFRAPDMAFGIGVIAQEVVLSTSDSIVVADRSGLHKREFKVPVLVDAAGANVTKVGKLCVLAGSGGTRFAAVVQRGIHNAETGNTYYLRACVYVMTLGGEVTRILGDDRLRTYFARSWARPIASTRFNELVVGDDSRILIFDVDCAGVRKLYFPCTDFVLHTNTLVTIHRSDDLYTEDLKELYATAEYQMWQTRADFNPDHFSFLFVWQ